MLGDTEKAHISLGLRNSRIVGLLDYGTANCQLMELKGIPVPPAAVRA